MAQPIGDGRDLTLRLPSFSGPRQREIQREVIVGVEKTLIRTSAGFALGTVGDVTIPLNTVLQGARDARVISLMVTTGPETMLQVIKPIPTTVGDVLILHTERHLTIYLIGVVTADGQHDFAGGEIVRSEPTPVKALAAGKRMLAPGRRMFLHHLDTREWLEIL